MKNRKKTAVLLIVLTVVAFALSLHPRAVVMNFAGENGERFPFYYRYWSLMPMGYGNWGPIITCVCAALTAILSILEFLTNKPVIFNWIRILGGAAVAGSLLNWLLGGMTGIGMLVLVLMAATTFFAHSVIQ